MWQTKTWMSQVRLVFYDSCISLANTMMPSRQGMHDSSRPMPHLPWSGLVHCPEAVRNKHVWAASSTATLTTGLMRAVGVLRLAAWLLCDGSTCAICDRLGVSASSQLAMLFVKDVLRAVGPSRGWAKQRGWAALWLPTLSAWSHPTWGGAHSQNNTIRLVAP
jgi:hypothetical protein